MSHVWIESCDANALVMHQSRERVMPHVWMRVWTRSSHLWMSHVTRMNWVEAPKWMRNITHMNQSRHTFGWEREHVGHTYERVKPRVCIWSLHTNEWVMSHLRTRHATCMHLVASHKRMSHVTHMNKSWHTYEWEREHAGHTYEWVMALVCIGSRYPKKTSHVTHMTESWHTYVWVREHAAQCIRARSSIHTCIIHVCIRSIHTCHEHAAQCIHGMAYVSMALVFIQKYTHIYKYIHIYTWHTCAMAHVCIALCRTNDSSHPYIWMSDSTRMNQRWARRQHL